MQERLPLVDKSTLLASPNPADTPQFQNLNDVVFEEMCCALLDKEPGIQMADRYNSERQKQYGVDIDGELEEGGCDVISCKVRARIVKGDLSAFSDEFLDHWLDYWKDKGVRRFILAITHDLKSKQRRSDIKIEKNRFKAIGVEYEVWSNRRLQEKLRPHLGIASQYLGPILAKHICGDPEQLGIRAADSETGIVNIALAHATEQMREALATELDERFAKFKELIFRGKQNDVLKMISNMKSDAIKWTALTDAQRARTVRYEGLIALNDKNFSLAHEKADEADAIKQASKEPTLRTILAFREGGAREALAQLLTVSDISGKQFKASLLIEAGEYKSAKKFLKSLLEESAENSETHRLCAYVYYFLGDRTEALKHLALTGRHGAHRLTVLRTRGIIMYASAISRGTEGHVIGWPNPIDQALVLTDADSQSLLKEAERHFSKLSDEIEDPESKEEYQTWYLAAQFLQSDNHNRASEYAIKLIEKDRTHVGALSWAISRGVEFNKRRSLNAIDNILVRGKNRADLVLIATVLDLSISKLKQAKARLDKYQDQFKSKGELELLFHWQAQIQILEKVENLDIKGWPAGLQLAYKLKFLSEKSEWSSVLSLVTSYHGHPEYNSLVIMLGRCAADAEQWSIVASLGRDLLKIATPVAIELAAFAAYNNGKPDDALSIIENNLDKFREQRPTSNLRRLASQAAIAAGDIPTAIATASNLFRETKLPGDRISLIETLMRKGDVSAAIPHIKEASKSGNLEPAHALEYAQIAALESPNTAQAILEENNLIERVGALQRGALTSLMFKLGMDSSVDSIIQAAAQPGDETASVWASNDIDELKRFLQRQQDTALKAYRRYQTGTSPVHFLAEFSNINLAEVYFARLHPDYKKINGSIRINSGRRRFDAKKLAKGGTLFTDLTSLLTAFSLDCLQDIIDGFGSITVPHSMQTVLLNLENDSGDNQPKYTSMVQQIISSLQSGSLSMLDDQTPYGIVEHQYKRKAIVEGEQLFCIEQEISKTSFSLIHMSFSQFLVRLDALGLYVVPPGNFLEPEENQLKLDTGCSLLLEPGTLTNLIELGVLGTVLENFNCSVTTDQVQFFHMQIAKSDAGIKLKKLISALRRWTAAKIQTGEVKLLPQESHDNALDRQSRHENREVKPIDWPLQELLDLKEQKNGFVWIDDRYINSFTNVNAMPLVAIIDVLSALRLSKKMSDARYFELIAKLRSSNALFIHIEFDEIISCLDEATIRDQQVISTPKLKNLQQYFALACLNEQNLVLHTDTIADINQRTDEVGLLLNLFKIAESALPEIWKRTDLSLEQKYAWSDWIWNNLRVEQFKALPVSQQTAEGRRNFTCMQITGLWISLWKIIDEELDNAKGFVTWVAEQAHNPLIHADPETDTILVKQLRQCLEVFLHPARQDDTPSDMQQVKQLVNEMIDLLPHAVRRSLFADKEFLQQLGRVTHSTVTIADHVFDASNLWSSVANAMEGNNAKLPTFDSNGEANVILAPEHGPNAIKLTGVVDALIVENFVGVLSNNVTKRLNTIVNLRKELDFTKQEATEFANTLVGKAAPERLMDVKKRQALSLRNRYLYLPDQLEDTRLLEFEDIEPGEPEYFTQFLRLENGDFSQQIEKSAKLLYANFGALEAFRRLSSLPCQIPLWLRRKTISEFISKPKKEFETFKGGMMTPLARVHLSSLVASQTTTSSRKRKLEFSIRNALRRYSPAASAFCSVLRWVDHKISTAKEWQSVSVAHKEAYIWSHAEYLCRAFFDVRMDPKWIKETFDGKAQSNPFTRKPSHSEFILASSPEYLTPEAILFFGLSGLLSNAQIKKLTRPELKLLREQLSMADQKFPAYDLVSSRSMVEDPINSFLSADDELLGGRIWGQEGRALLSAKNAEAVAHSVINYDPAQKNSEELLRSIMMMGCWQASRYSSEIWASVSKSDLYDFSILDLDESLLRLRGLSSVLRWLKTPTQPHKLSQNLLELCDRLGRNYSGDTFATNVNSDDRKSDFLLALLECGLFVSLSKSDSKSTEDFAGLVSGFLDRWPETKTTCGQVMSNLIERVPPKCRSELWKTIWKARAG